MHPQTAEAKIMTDLTCWKCGEESLKEFAPDEETRSAKGEKITSSAIRHSDCQKCGAYSINPAQLRVNQTIARSNRKAVIKEANRKLA